MPAITSDEHAKLLKQIGKYRMPKDFTVDDVLSSSGQDPNVLKKQLGFNPEEKKDLSKLERQQYEEDPRVAFINFLKEYQPPQASRSPLNISLKQLLGSRGAELFKRAVEAERNSAEFKEACFLQSVEVIHDYKWEQRPVVIVAGPSACGKSYISKKVLQKVKDCVPKKKGPIVNNYVVGIDGGKIRETSQMRKLLIQVALKQGYSGINDLQSNTSELGEYKTQMEKIVQETEHLGMVIPKTYTKEMKKKGTYIRPEKQFKKLDSLKKSFLVFANITGADKEQFKRTVSCMGHSRAWGTGHETFDYDLNDPDIELPESKKPEPENFKWGVRFSARFREAFLKYFGSEAKYIDIENDLIPVECHQGKLQQVNYTTKGKTFFMSKKLHLEYVNNSQIYKGFVRQHGKAITEQRDVFAFASYAEKKDPSLGVTIKPSVKLNNLAARNKHSDMAQKVQEQQQEKASLPLQNKIPQAERVEAVHQLIIEIVQKEQKAITFTPSVKMEDGLLYEVEFKADNVTHHVRGYEDRIEVPTKEVDEITAEIMMRIYVKDQVPDWDGTIPPIDPVTHKNLEIEINCKDPHKFDLLQRAAESFKLEVVTPRPEAAPQQNS